MTDLECYINTLGYLEYLQEADNLKPGDSIFVAGDLRDSTPRITAAVIKAIQDKGNEVEYYGLIPTPAIAYYGFIHDAPSIEITGSHIPADRNGIKFHKRSSEVLKVDEAGIKRHVARIRNNIYEQDFNDSLFTEDGALRTPPQIPEAKEDARRSFIDRYSSQFDRPLRGRHIVLYQHSAVGRDMLHELLEKLGAQVSPVGRSESFVPIDTENVTTGNKAYFKKLAKQYPDNFAIVSTDGDSDRPFVIDEEGVFYRGDILGAVVAENLGAEYAAITISSNDAVNEFCEAKGIALDHTRIGSPYVISSMQEVADKFDTIVGWEVNGGFLLGSEAPFGKGKLRPLPTRDAFLPIISILNMASEQNKRVSEIFRALPKRYTGGGLLDLTDDAILPMRKLDDSPATKAIVSEVFENTPLGSPVDINYIDGLRMTFEGGDVIHIRASGNAPQLRVYTNCNSQERADSLVVEAIKQGGLLENFANSLNSSS